MSQAKIRVALQKAADSITPVLQTAYENEPFNAVDGQAWQRFSLLPAAPSTPALSGEGLVVYRGYLQIDLFYPLLEGVGNAEARVLLIAQKFKRSSSFSSGGVTVTINAAPEVLPARVDSGYHKVLVRIPYIANTVNP